MTYARNVNRSEADALPPARRDPAFLFAIVKADHVDRSRRFGNAQLRKDLGRRGGRRKVVLVFPVVVFGFVVRLFRGAVRFIGADPEKQGDPRHDRRRAPTQQTDRDFFQTKGGGDREVDRNERQKTEKRRAQEQSDAFSCAFSGVFVVRFHPGDDLVGFLLDLPRRRGGRLRDDKRRRVHRLVFLIVRNIDPKKRFHFALPSVCVRICNVHAQYTIPAGWKSTAALASAAFGNY